MKLLSSEQLVAITQKIMEHRHLSEEDCGKLVAFAYIVDAITHKEAIVETSTELPVHPADLFGSTLRVYGLYHIKEKEPRATIVHFQCCDGSTIEYCTLSHPLCQREDGRNYLNTFIADNLEWLAVRDRNKERYLGE